MPVLSQCSIPTATCGIIHTGAFFRYTSNLPCYAGPILEKMYLYTCSLNDDSFIASS